MAFATYGRHDGPSRRLRQRRSQLVGIVEGGHDAVRLLTLLMALAQHQHRHATPHRHPCPSLAHGPILARRRGLHVARATASIRSPNLVNDRTAMKLYYMPGACSIGIHVLLEEIGKPYDLQKIDGATLFGPASLQNRYPVVSFTLDGVQLVGDMFREDDLLAVAWDLEEALPWRRLAPGYGEGPA